MKEFRGKTRIRRIKTSRMSAVSTREGRERIVDRVCRFYEMDESSRNEQKNDRLQRYAKFRMIAPGKDWPWPDASDTTMPDMMTQSLRIQDTLHNSIMSSEFPVAAHPLNDKGVDNAENVNKLITHQIFVDAKGENLVGDFAEAFVNDGPATMMTSWVKEKVDTTRVKVFEALAPDQPPRSQFRALLSAEFPKADITEQKEGWDYLVKQGEDEKKIAFYTLEDDRIEMVVSTKIIAFDGPRPMVYNWENVLHPPRAANLNFPSPHNPRGASHVILREYPTINQIMQDAEDGFYDLPEEEEKQKLFQHFRTGKDEELEDQKDQISGESDHNQRTTEAESHRTLTLLICFDGFDINKDGVDEQVVWWVVKETKLLLKAALLQEIWPFIKPRRPFSEATYLPVEGRRQGIGLLEIVEGFYEAKKILLDQTIDSNAVQNLPFFFYRPTGGTRPETVTLSPGEGYPLGDPQRDVNFPNLQSNVVANNINLMRQLTAEEEKLTLTGDIQFGRVPPGASSALRTVGGMALLQNQGEARPERILRRFFLAFTELYSQIHELNQVFLPKEKRIMIMRPKTEKDDPYEVIRGIDDITGLYEFTFSANVFNTSRVALQQSLGALAQFYINPIAIQTGVIDAEGIYRLLRDMGKAQGQDPDQYLRSPTPLSRMPKIFAAEAIAIIMGGQVPEAIPIEAAEVHLQTLIAFANEDALFGQLSIQQAGLFGQYVNIVRQLTAQEQETQALAAAAQQGFQEEGQVGRPPESAPDTTQQPNLQPNRLEEGAVNA